ncbi:MAG: flagellin FliC [Gammaproteobacteria bacterium]|nr:flagellin FliC [Gammaproteobacteria bacterium]
MATINTNMSANIATNAMTRNERSMGATMERLSTGIRINSAKDDAAGLAISSKMSSQINGLNQAVRNANDAISMIQVAEGAMGGMTNMLQRMRELAIQAISDSNTATDRTALDSEFDELKAAINDLAEDTQWNGTALLTGNAGSAGTVTFQIGANASQTIAVKFADFTTNETLNTSNVVADEPLKSLQTDSDAALDAVLGNSTSTGLNISTSSDAALALVGLADAITNVDSQRATLGASMSRLEYASDNLTNIAQNTSAARSRILDADYAAETTELARTQIIQQAATAMLAQANQSQQQVLALLR